MSPQTDWMNRMRRQRRCISCGKKREQHYSRCKTCRAKQRARYQRLKNP